MKRDYRKPQIKHNNAAHDLLWEIRNFYDVLNDGELINVRKDLQSLDSTNCAAQLFYAKDYLLKVVTDIQAERYQRRNYVLSKRGLDP